MMKVYIMLVPVYAQDGQCNCLWLPMKHTYTSDTQIICTSLFFKIHKMLNVTSVHGAQHKLVSHLLETQQYYYRLLVIPIDNVQ